jgi:hypothetical protein
MRPGSGRVHAGASLIGWRGLAELMQIGGRSQPRYIRLIRASLEPGCAGGRTESEMSFNLGFMLYLLMNVSN